MTRLSAALIASVCSLASTALAADCAPDANPRNVQLTYEGHEGLWFDARVAACMADRLELVPLYLERIDLLTLRASESDAQVDLLRSALLASKDANQTMLLTVDILTRRALRAESSRDVWYRSPFLWAGVGVATTISIGILVAVLAGAL